MNEDNSIELGKIQLTGWKAVLLILVIVGFTGYRILGVHDVSDNTGLVQAIQTELENKIRRQILPELQEAYNNNNLEEARELQEELSDYEVEVHKVISSEPIIPFLSSKEFMVGVTFSYAMEPEVNETVYLEVEKLAFDSWLVDGRKRSKFQFYMAKF